MAYNRDNSYDDSYDPTQRRRLLIDNMDSGPNATPQGSSAPPDASAEPQAPSSGATLAPSPTSTGPDNPPPTFPPGTLINDGPGTRPGETGELGTTGPTITTQPVDNGRTTEPQPWDPNANAPAGMKWDPNVATYVPVGQAFDPKGYSFNGSSLVGNSIPPAGPTGGNAQNDILAHIAAFAQAHPNANPSITRDPNYWAGRIAQVSGNGPIDWGYWESRMLQPEGPPEGAQGPGLGGVRYTPQTGYQFGYQGSGGLPPELSAFYNAQTAAIQQQQAQYQQTQAAMRDSLLKLMAQGQEPVDVTNDKTLGPAAEAYRNAQMRQSKQSREALAERYAAEGLNSGGQGSGAFDTAVQGLDENTRNSIAGYEAQLAQTELQNRRQLTVQALQIAQALGARTESNALQEELANLDAQLRQQQLQYNYTQLGQQQGQFEDTLGYNYAGLQAQMNRDAFLHAMGY